jgi:N-acetylglucosaminyl-diphospho-decaprenol L-rhamnosyltransferase
MTSGPETLTVLLVSYNTRDLLDPCLSAVAKARAYGGGIDGPDIVVDNASRDGSADFLSANYPHLKLIRSPKNVGFGRANNLALPVSSKYLLLLNTDAFVPEDAFSRTIEFMEAHPRCGVLGVRLVGRDGDLQPSCRYFPTPLNTFLTRTGLARMFPGVRLVDDMQWDHASVRSCDWVPGCFYLLRRELVEQVGLFDPLYFLYFEEVDHCRASKAMGWDVVYFPDVSVVHIGGESARSLGELSSGGRQVEILQLEAAQLYFRKNHGIAGALANLFLSELADLILLLKLLVRGQARSQLAYYGGRMRATLALAFKSRLGAKPIH